MSAESRDALLTAIAKARAWIDDLVEGRIASFAEIAKPKARSSAISGFWRRWRLFRRRLFQGLLTVWRHRLG